MAEAVRLYSAIEPCKRLRIRIALLEFGIMLISQNETVIEQTEMEVAPRYKLLVHCLR